MHDGIQVETLASDEGVVARLSREGPSVRMTFWDTMPDGVGLVAQGKLETMAEQVGETIESLGGRGESYLVVRANFAGRTVSGTAESADWIATPRPTAAELAWAARSMRRGAGRTEWEPEPS